MNLARYATFLVLYASLSAVAGLVIGASYGLLSGLLENSGFFLWLAAIAGVLGALIGAGAFLGGSAAYLGATRAHLPIWAKRGSAAIAAGSVAVVIVLLVAQPYLVDGAAVTVGAGVAATLIAWLGFPALRLASKN